MNVTYIYRFWHTLFNPSSLTDLIEKEEERHAIQGYKQALSWIFIWAIVYFTARDFWGMYTNELTALAGQGQIKEYIAARYISLIGALLFGILFFVFHYYFFTYLIALFTDLPFNWVKKIQLYVLFVLLAFKTIEFLLFVIIGYTPLFSPFSLASIFAQWTSNLWVLFFINQLSFATFIIIIIQYTFLEHWDYEHRKSILVKLIFIHLLFAAITATISILPIMDWIGKGVN